MKNPFQELNPPPQKNILKREGASCVNSLHPMPTKKKHLRCRSSQRSFTKILKKATNAPNESVSAHSRTLSACREKQTLPSSRQWRIKTFGTHRKLPYKFLFNLSPHPQNICHPLKISHSINTEGTTPGFLHYEPSIFVECYSPLPLIQLYAPKTEEYCTPSPLFPARKEDESEDRLL